MNNVTTAFDVVDHYEKDLNAFVNGNFKIVDAVLFFLHKQI